MLTSSITIQSQAAKRLSTLLRLRIKFRSACAVLTGAPTPKKE